MSFNITLFAEYIAANSIVIFGVLLEHCKNFIVMAIKSWGNNMKDTFNYILNEKARCIRSYSNFLKIISNLSEIHHSLINSKK